MATTLMPLDPETSPQRAVRLLDISADLLPEEVIAGRRGRHVRGRVLGVLAVFTVLLCGWFGYAWNEARIARGNLDTITNEAQVLQHQQLKYADVVRVQDERDAIKSQLTALLTDDLRWTPLLGTLRSAGAPAGIVITGVTGSLATSADAAPAAGKLPSSTSNAVVGNLLITGAAPDNPSLARYVEALGAQPVLANPYLTSAAQAQGKVQFSLQVDMTATALGGRFAPTPAATAAATGGN